ncbi:MAG: DNA-processing protein DprA [Actinomycetota bacterium]
MNDHDAALAVLAALPRQSPARLRRVLAGGDPCEMVESIAAGGRPIVGLDPSVWAAWSSSVAMLRATVPGHCEAANIGVALHGGEGYPPALVGDPWAPPVLFVRGDARAVRRRRVGIVGTRHATRAGRAFARVLGDELARAGVCVVSGLARGIDVEAHAGALAAEIDGAPPVAVVASGCDTVYPPEHHRIWHDIAERGLIVSEAPPGTAPTARMFPQRNRVLAGLSEILVVVESRARGGSMITVREAAKRAIPVMAVPGAPTSPASEGTNLLLADGCAPVTDACDVLVALGLDTSRTGARVDTRVSPSSRGAEILAVLRGAAQTVDGIVLATGFGALDVAVALGRLEAQGWVAHADGWWESLPG